MHASTPATSSHVYTKTAEERTARGAKHTCGSCHVRYYDMGKSPVCPACRHINVIAKLPAKRGRRRA